MLSLSPSLPSLTHELIAFPPITANSPQSSAKYRQIIFSKKKTTTNSFFVVVLFLLLPTAPSNHIDLSLSRSDYYTKIRFRFILSSTPSSMFSIYIWKKNHMITVIFLYTHKYYRYSCTHTQCVCIDEIYTRVISTYKRKHIPFADIIVFAANLSLI